MDVQLLVIYIVALIVGLYIFKPAKQKKEIPTLPYKQMFEIIDIAIARELAFRIQDYELREVVIISRFETEVKDITSSVITQIKQDFLDELLFYHPRDYIILYISRHARDQLIEYMGKNNPKIK